MPKILVNVSERQKQLWVVAAHDERVSLSEWVRRRCDAGLVAEGTVGAETDPGTPGVPREGTPASPRSPSAASPGKCPREARHHINHSGKPCPECGYPKTTT